MTRDAHVARARCNSERQYLRDLPQDEFPVLASMATALASGDSDDHLRFGVDVLIVGIWAYAQGRAETPAEKPPATDSASK